MPVQTLMQTVEKMTRDPDSIKDVAELLFVNPSSEDTEVLDRAQLRFYKKLNETAVQWMAQGKVEKINQLIQVLLNTVLKGKTRDFLKGSMSLKDLHLMNWQVLINVIHEFLRSDNPARRHGVALELCHKRRQKWAVALLYMKECGSDRYVTIEDLCQPSLFRSESAARYFINKMKVAKVLEEVGRCNRRKCYCLTSFGKKVAVLIHRYLGIVVQIKTSE